MGAGSIGSVLALVVEQSAKWTTLKVVGA